MTEREDEMMRIETLTLSHQRFLALLRVRARDDNKHDAWIVSATKLTGGRG